VLLLHLQYLSFIHWTLLFSYKHRDEPRLPQQSTDSLLFTTAWDSTVTAGHLDMMPLWCLLIILLGWLDVIWLHLLYYNKLIYPVELELQKDHELLLEHS
jgi:hypothetical protein